MNIPYKWKVVLRDALGNEHLMGFFRDMQEAKEKMAMAQQEKDKNNAIGELAIKAVDPEWLPCPIKSDYTMFVRSLIQDDQWDKCKDMPTVDEFFYNDHGRMHDYYMLAKIIPIYYTVIDLGCGNNAQSFLFAQHKRFIAVDDSEQLFRAPGTLFYQMPAKKFIADIIPQLKLDMRKTFAICSNVKPKGDDNPAMMTRMNFLNMFTINNQLT